MAVRHTYASTDAFRDYLAGTSYASSWTADSAPIKTILESQSRLIDDYVAMGSFGPRTETRYYDIGSGSLRDSKQVIVDTTSSDVLGLNSAYRSSIVFNSWLLSATTVTSYKATDRDSSETLVEGYNQDYWLMPYNENPKYEMKLNEDTAKAFYGGQQTLSVLGNWGYTNDTVLVTTADAVASTTATSVSVSSASGFSIAQTMLIDTEQMYITGISGNTLTVERGVNGTTAATHSGGASAYRYDYPPQVVQACLDMAKIVYRDRDMGTTQMIGYGETAITRAPKEVFYVLETLSTFRVGTAVVF